MTKNYWAFIKRLYHHYGGSVDGLADQLIKIEVAKKKIVHADILKLFASPIELIPAIPNTIIVPVNFIIQAHKPTPYSGVAAAEDIHISWYILGAGHTKVAEIETTNLLTGAADGAFAFWTSDRTINPVDSISVAMGASLEVRIDTAEVAGGAAGNYIFITLAYFRLARKYFID